MSDDHRECPKCKLHMERGYILDNAHGGLLVASWVESTPVKSRWKGLDIKGKRAFELVAYRCVGCGYVDLYAL